MHVAHTSLQPDLARILEPSQGMEVLQCSDIPEA